MPASLRSPVLVKSPLNVGKEIILFSVQNRPQIQSYFQSFRSSVLLAYGVAIVGPQRTKSSHYVKVEIVAVRSDETKFFKLFVS
jgi:hypothetical protein